MIGLTADVINYVANRVDNTSELHHKKMLERATDPTQASHST